MAKKELKMRAMVAPTETVIVSAYDENKKADACTLAFYRVSSHIPPCVTIGINATQKRKTLKDILETKAFVLGFPGADQVREADYIGVESGDDVVLKRINKGYTAAEAREQLEKIDASGLPYVVNFLNGAGGHGYGLTNAQWTAALYDGLHMTMVNTSMLTVVPGTPLYRAMEKGLYTESTEKEKLEEIHELVRCLNNDTIFMNEHASNLFHVQCRLPEAKEELLAYIQKFMESSDEKELRQYRERVTRAFR